MKNILGRLGVYQKMLANLVSWLRTSFNWNCLTIIWVGFLKLVRIMLETWTMVLKYTYLVSENVPFSTRTSLILLISADHASKVRLLDCFKLAINRKMTMTSFTDQTSSSSFFWLYHVFLVKFSYWSKFHVNIITGSGVIEVFL